MNKIKEHICNEKCRTRLIYQSQGVWCCPDYEITGKEY